MKLFFIALTALFSTNLHAQYTATWGFTSNSSNTSLIGAQASNVVVANATAGSSLSAPTYNTDGIKCAITAATWPTAATDGYSVDIPISPAAGADITITGLTFSSKISGASGNTYFSLAYQIDGAGPWIAFGAQQTAASGGTRNINFGSLSQIFYNTHTYLVRIYVFAASSVSNSRSATIKNAAFVGTATVPAATPPGITTDNVNSITKYSATAFGTITAGTIPIISSGICWSLNTNPSITDNVVNTSPTATSGSFNVTITGLSVNTSYHARAYTTTAAGTIYGSDIPFTTLPATIPSLTTVDPNGFIIKARSATSGGNFLDSGGVAITAKGIVFNTTGNPQLPSDNPTSDGQFSANYNSALINLLPSTTYYVRSYATNSVGTGYGNVISFMTAAQTTELIVNPANLNLGDAVINGVSAAQSFALSGYLLSPASGSVTITAPDGFQVSTSATAGFASSITVNYTGGTINPTNIYVHMNPTVYGNAVGTITVSGGTAADQTVTVTGTGVQSPSDFSNSGTDFWTGYGYQSLMSSSNSQDMILYLSSQQLDTVMVEIPGIGYPAQQYIVQPNVALATSPFPKGAPYDPRLLATGKFPYGIHIYSLNNVPTAVWAHIYASQSAGATLVLPTYTWGTDYTVLTVGGQTNSSSNPPHTFFFVQAAEDNTTIDIVPSADITATAGGTTVLYPAGDTIKVTLNKGDVFNALGKLNSSTNGDDLTGTRITSEDCSKKIAVFTGNGRVQLPINGCTPTNGGSDNFIQQMFPRVAWGTKYLTSPFRTMEAGLYRIVVQDTSTNIIVNGQALPHTSLLPVSSPNQFYYEVVDDTPNVITSDKPVMVAQFCATNSCDGTGLPDHPNTGNSGDPEMVVISPVQQAINNVTVFSATEYAIQHNYINVIIPKAGVASFQFDGVAASDAFLPHTQDSSYYYAVFADIQGGVSHHLSSDFPFNAIAYGFSNSSDNESYGYNAGTQVNNLTSPLILQNQYGSPINSSNQVPTTCRGTNFRVAATLPYQTNQITFGFSGNPHINPNTDTTLTNGQANITPDSTFTDNGQTFYVYKLSTPYVFDTTGQFPIQITSFDPTVSISGCSGGNTKIINYNVTVVTGLTANFGIVYNSCVGDSVLLSDSSVSAGHIINSWLWSYNNNTTLLPAAIDTLQNPRLKNPVDNTAKNYSLRAVNDIGCYNQITKALPATVIPTVTLGTIQNVCINATPITLTGGNPAGGVFKGRGVQAGNFIPSSAGAGADTITYVYTIPAGCADSAKQIFTVNPSLSFTPTGPFCNNNDAVTLIPNISGGTFNGTGISGSSSFDPSIATIGSNRIIYTTEVAGSCSDTVFIVVNDSPHVFAGGPGLVVANFVPVTINATADAGSYVWSPITGLSSSTVLNPQANPRETTLYALAVTNAANCTSIDTVTVTVTNTLPCFHPLEFFTPNGDGTNDSWKIYATTSCNLSANVSVYNRWGGLVYHADKYNEDWKGTYKGSDLPDGTYYYVIQVTLPGNSYSSTYTGNVTIVR